MTSTITSPAVETHSSASPSVIKTSKTVKETADNGEKSGKNVKKSTQAFIIINGQQIPWSFVGKVRMMFKGDWDDAIDCFWKARNATGYNGVQKYILKGFIPNNKGIRYSMQMSKEREEGKMDSLREWWNSLYARKGRSDMMSVRDVFKFLAESM